MKIILSVCLILGYVQLCAQDTETPPVWKIDLQSGTQSFKGDISQGIPISLGWAAQSNVACFPATRFEEFQGTHVFYMLELPRRSILTVQVSPVDESNRINIYGFSGHDGVSLPPDIHRVVSCEAGYEMYVGNTDLSHSAGPQSIELNAINNPYKVLIGIAGAKGTDSGEFILTTTLKDR